jgi:hypothetical protein
LCSPGLNFVFRQAGEMLGKMSGGFAEGARLCRRSARANGHGAAYSSKKFVTRDYVGKQWSADTVNRGVNVFGIATSVMYTS